MGATGGSDRSSPFGVRAVALFAVGMPPAVRLVVHPWIDGDEITYEVRSNDENPNYKG